jgi:nucleosome assembly protein 1-like 1
MINACFLTISLADTNQTRVVKKVVPTDSFFTFFSPPNPPSEDDDLPEEEQEEIEQRLELDYQIGEDLKDRVRGQPSTSAYQRFSR